MAKILIIIPYKNSYKHYFKFPDLEKKGLAQTLHFGEIYVQTEHFRPKGGKII